MDKRANNGDFNRFGDAWKVTVFNKQRQPNDEQRQKAWRTRKHGSELVRAILTENFNNEHFKQAFSTHMGIPIEELDDMSNECAILYAQLAKAVGKGDTFAFEALMTRAYGKPKEIKTDEDYVAPVINIQLGDGDDSPEIPSLNEDDTQD